MILPGRKHPGGPDRLISTVDLHSFNHYDQARTLFVGYHHRRHIGVVFQRLGDLDLFTLPDLESVRDTIKMRPLTLAVSVVDPLGLPPRHSPTNTALPSPSRRITSPCNFVFSVMDYALSCLRNPNACSPARITNRTTADCGVPGITLDCLQNAANAAVSS
jgi:hypothetical protein